MCWIWSLREAITPSRRWRTSARSRRASIGELSLRGAVVADVTLERPIVYVDRTQVRREVRDEVPLRKRGWQDAVRAMIPLEINEVHVRDGDVTYLDDFAFEPLRLTGIQARAANIRNIDSRDREYPSELSIEARVFEKGRLAVRGSADFLARPVPGVSLAVELEGSHWTTSSRSCNATTSLCARACWRSPASSRWDAPPHAPTARARARRASRATTCARR